MPAVALRPVLHLPLCLRSGASLSDWDVLPHFLCLLSIIYLVKSSSGMHACPVVGGMTTLSLRSIYSSPTCPPTYTPTIHSPSIFLFIHPLIFLPTIHRPLTCSCNHLSRHHLFTHPFFHIPSPSSLSSLPPALPSLLFALH